MTAKPWTPTLRETVAVTTNTKRRLVTMATERHPDVPIMLAMWRVFADGLDALEREASHEADLRRVAVQPGRRYAMACVCPDEVECSCGGAR